MAMTPEEKRKWERERKARQRAAQRERAQLEALPRIGAGGRDGGGTAGAAPGVVSNESAALAFVESLAVPASAKPRVALLLTLARDLDSGAVAQRSAIAQRYEETMERLIAAARPVERDELDELRRSFYSGRVDGIDDDPEAATRRTVRKKA
jgi:hypothetical protein